MLSRLLRVCRSHPVLVATFIGAAFGAANVIAIEVGGVARESSGDVLSLLWYSSGQHKGQLNAIQTATLLLIEVAGNVLAFALLFALPVALFAGVRRIFARRSTSTDESDPAPADPDRL